MGSKLHHTWVWPFLLTFLIHIRTRKRGHWAIPQYIGSMGGPDYTMNGLKGGKLRIYLVDCNIVRPQDTPYMGSDLSPRVHKFY